MLNTSRKYKVAISDIADLSIEDVSFKTLTDGESDAEFIYSMRQIIDSILDLKVGESIYFHPDRDDESTHGIIRRVS